MLGSRCVIVGGGTGFVGRHLVSLLKSHGAKVKVITRKPDVCADQISWKIVEQNGLPSETTDVINLAGRNILDPVPWTKSFKDEVYSSRIETNRKLARAIERAPRQPQSFIVTSGVGYYKTSETDVYDESWRMDDKTAGSSFLTKLAKDWEEASEFNKSAAPDTRRIIIRAGVVIGPDGGIVKNLSTPFKMGLGGPVGNGKQWFPWIHVADLVEMYKLAMTNDKVEGVINGVAPDLIRNKDFAKAFAKALDRPSFFPLPSFVVNTLFGPERGKILLQGMQVKSRAESLGLQFKYPDILSACQNSVQ